MYLLKLTLSELWCFSVDLFNTFRVIL